MSPNTVGALLMMASMASFTLNDTLIKLTGGAVPLMQLLVLRGVVSSVLIVVLARWLGSIHFRIARRDWGLIAVRSGAEVGAAYFFITALLNMPLANVTAILQVLPLTVAVGAALFFREPLGWRRMSAILIGFMGMLLIVRPGGDGFSIWSLYALIAVACVTVRDLATRRLSAGVPSMTVTLVAAVTVMAFAGVSSTTTEWVPIDRRLALLIGGASVFIIGGYFFSVQVMRVGEISFIAPFRYTGLIWALVLGWIVFGDWPSSLTLLGAAIVVATGLFTLYRERRVSGG
ncbi:DMT family transporter [Tateyamaria omphalii]|uniref:EamA family transporter n=1 Tax=Tateyamaria omphalii TaxID=299262 RepID=A0A1P8MWY5_9RHOB|nr:DMT family transporter [Tateyamaria omphalii]APX12531.1 EamA family transporter [Tateyamaria omphalii]